MRMAVQSGETTGARVGVAGKPEFRAVSDLMLSHEMSWHIGTLARKEEGDLLWASDSLQETGRKDGWAKCQELVSIGISSCWSLRSSCRAGWIASLPSTSMATSPLPEPDSGPLWFPQGFLSCYRVAERLTWGLLIFCLGPGLSVFLFCFWLLRLSCS